MFVLSQESKEALQSYVKALHKPSFTDSRESFLRQHNDKSIEAAPVKEGDIIVVHEPAGEHAAVVCMDERTKQLYTMQKPNPTEMPVKLSLDQFVRAEKVENSSIEVYRKK